MNETPAERYEHVSSLVAAARDLQGAELHLPRDDSRLMGCLEWYAWLLHSAGFDQQAEPFWGELYAAKVRVLGAEAPRTRHTLADWRFSQGRFAESEQLFRDLLAECLAKDPDMNGTGTVIQMSNLAEVLPHVDKLDEAEQLLRDAIGGFGRVWGRSNKRTLEMTARLAGIERQLGKLAADERTLRDTLARQQRSLSPDHPDTLATRRALDEVLAAREEQR